jgi:phosphohistidine phosphatase
MPKLFVLRHAKSSWSDTGLRDFDRPLANRGLKAATAMGETLRAEKIAPDFILCSTSRRTRETLGLLLPHLTGEARILMEDSVYEAGSETAMIDRLRRLPADIRRAMVIGHNPVMQDLTTHLCETARDPADLDAVAAKFPTAALAVIDLGDTPWPALGAGCGTLMRFIRPRDLSD